MKMKIKKNELNIVILSLKSGNFCCLLVQEVGTASQHDSNRIQIYL